MVCCECGQTMPNDALFCLYCGAKLSYPIDKHTAKYFPHGLNPKQLQAYRRGMVWYKSILYFFIFFNLVLCLFNIAILFFGLSYDAYILHVYVPYPGLQALDAGMLAVYILLSMYAVYMWWNLEAFKQKGVKQFLLSFIFQLISVVVYQLVRLAIVYRADLPFLFYFQLMATILGNAVFCFGLFAVNYVYFKKRAPLFCY